MACRDSRTRSKRGSADCNFLVSGTAMVTEAMQHSPYVHPPSIECQGWKLISAEAGIADLLGINIRCCQHMLFSWSFTDSDLRE